MRYEHTEHLGEHMVTKEYEGTPEEIAELLAKQPEKISPNDMKEGTAVDTKCDVKYIANQLGKMAKDELRAKGSCR